MTKQEGLDTYLKTTPSFSEERDYLNTYLSKLFGVGMLIMLLVLVGAFVYMLNRPAIEVPKYQFFTYDSSTGIVAETRDIDSSALASEWKLNRFFLTEYISACGRYDPKTWGDDYIKCQLLSSDDRASAYQNYVNSSLFVGRLLGKDGHSKLSNIRITPLGQSTNQAQVQWIDTRSKSNGQTKNYYYSAIVDFEYNDKYIQEYGDQVNSTGFAVTVFNQTEITQQ